MVGRVLRMYVLKCWFSHFVPTQYDQPELR